MSAETRRCDWCRSIARGKCGCPAEVEIERLRAAVAGPTGYVTWQDAAIDERVRRVRAEAKIVRLTEWMAAQGLLHYHDHCKRPDGSSGPAWVVRKPAQVWGDACEAWHATAAGAVNTWLAGVAVLTNVRAKRGPTA